MIKGISAYKSLLVFAAILTLLIVVPMPCYVLHILTLICIFASLVTCWSLPARADVISLGHASFFGIGAYIPTLLFLNFRMTPLLGMWVGAVVAVVLALLVGYPCFRFGVKGIYFAIATLVMAEGVKLVCVTLRNITGGMNGLSVTYMGNAPLYLQFTNPKLYYVLAFVLLLLTLYVKHRIDNGRIGFFLSAIAENEVAAASLGVEVLNVKLQTLAISAALCALTGTVYAQFAGYISPPSVLSLDVSIKIILFAIVGGIYSFWGPMFGAFLMVPISEALRLALGVYAGDMAWVLYGCLIVIVIIMRPQGILARRKF